jgi:dsRNA-specific ribonuclease
MRESCAEAAKAKGWDRYVIVGKGYRKISDKATTNMLAELYEAVWGAIYLDAKGDTEGDPD